MRIGSVTGHRPAPAIEAPASLRAQAVGCSDCAKDAQREVDGIEAAGEAAEARTEPVEPSTADVLAGPDPRQLNIVGTAYAAAAYAQFAVLRPVDDPRRRPGPR